MSLLTTPYHPLPPGSGAPGVGPRSPLPGSDRAALSPGSLCLRLPPGGWAVSGRPQLPIRCVKLGAPSWRPLPAASGDRAGALACPHGRPHGRCVGIVCASPSRVSACVSAWACALPMGPGRSRARPHGCSRGRPVRIVTWHSPCVRMRVPMGLCPPRGFPPRLGSLGCVSASVSGFRPRPGSGRAGSRAPEAPQWSFLPATLMPRLARSSLILDTVGVRILPKSYVTSVPYFSTRASTRARACPFPRESERVFM